jgi:hypothetical protein
MYTPIDSEAREWRRGTLLGIAVLLFSVAGEVVLNPHDEPTSSVRKTACPLSYSPPTRAFRFLNYFITPASR